MSKQRGVIQQPWFVMAIAFFAQTAGSTVSQSVYPLMAVWQAAFSLSQGEAALPVTLMNGGQIISMILLARAIDRHGERAVVSCSMLAMAAMALITAAYARSFYALLPGLAMIGALYAAVPLGGSRAVIAWFPPDRRGLATGLLQGAVPLGSVVAGGLMPAIALWAGWRAALVALGLIGISGGLAFWFFYRGHGLTVTAKKRSEIPIRDLLRLLGRTPGYLRLLLAGIAMTSLQFALTAHIIFFLMSAFEYSIAMAAALFSLIQMAGLASRLLLPWMGDHVFPGQRIPFLAAIMTGAALATTMLAFLPPDAPNWLVSLTLVCFGVCGVGWYPLFLLQMSEMAPGSAVAATVGVGTTLCKIAMAVVPLLFGFLVDWSGYLWAWASVTLPIFALAIALWTLPRAAMLEQRAK